MSFKSASQLMESSLEEQVQAVEEALAAFKAAPTFRTAFAFHSTRRIVAYDVWNNYVRDNLSLKERELLQKLLDLSLSGADHLEHLKESDEARRKQLMRFIEHSRIRAHLLFQLLHKGSVQAEITFDQYLNFSHRRGGSSNRLSDYESEQLYDYLDMQAA
jgi:hypothetical protein